MKRKYSKTASKRLPQHSHHWPYIYHRRQRFKHISGKQIMVGQLVAVTGSLAAGYILELNKASIALFAGALILLPGIIDLAASITGAMCAKINHRLELGGKTFQIVQNSVLFALLLSVLSGLVVGVCGGIIGELFFGSTFWHICALSVATMVSVGLVAYPVMGLLTAITRKLGLDPDNLVGPVESGVTDMLTVLAVSIIVRFFV